VDGADAFAISADGHDAFQSHAARAGTDVLGGRTAF
jgi:hypothetical protein